MQGSTEQILSILIRAEDVDLALFHAKKIQAARDEPEQLVTVTRHEELYIVAFILVDLGDPAKVRRHRTFTLYRMDKRPHRTAVLVTELRDLRRTVGVILVAARDGRIVRRQERREQARDHQKDQNAGRDHRRTLFLEARPDELPLRGGEIRLLCAALYRVFGFDYGNMWAGRSRQVWIGGIWPVCHAVTSRYSCGRADRSPQASRPL